MPWDIDRLTVDEFMQACTAIDRLRADIAKANSKS